MQNLNSPKVTTRVSLKKCPLSTNSAERDGSESRFEYANGFKLIFHVPDSRERENVSADYCRCRMK
jgi:hypothetical protein